MFTDHPFVLYEVTQYQMFCYGLHLLQTHPLKLLKENKRIKNDFKENENRKCKYAASQQWLVKQIPNLVYCLIKMISYHDRVRVVWLWVMPIHNTPTHTPFMMLYSFIKMTMFKNVVQEHLLKKFWDQFVFITAHDMYTREKWM